jgi:putative aldouronate transport system permease protein
MTAVTTDAARRKKINNVKRHIPFYLMALPGMIYLFINNYMPLPGLILAFKKYSTRLGIFGSPWIGLDNFKYLFVTQDAWIITRNTVGYNLVFIVTNLVCAVTVAIILTEMKTRSKKLYQSAILLPHFLSSVIISYLVYALLSSENGFLNNSILPLFGVEYISWYSEPKYWPYILVFVQLWRSVGYSCIIYISSIMGFDSEIFEAARIDGASKMQQIFQITIPLLRPTMIMIVLLAVGRIFNSDFGLFYQIPQRSGALMPVTQTIDTYVYRGLLERNSIAMASAAGFYQSIVGFILILSANLLVRKIDKDSALF